jgi:hypothetical protein
MSIYRELRQVLEAVVAQEPGALEAASRYLAGHCPSCGVALVAQQRLQGGWCERCAVPATTPTNIRHSSIPAHWPVALQETVSLLWPWPAVQELLNELARLGFLLPLLSPSGPPAAQTQRQALYDHAEAMSAVVRARAGQVGFTHLGALLFGSRNNNLVDELSKRLWAAAPEAAAVPSRHIYPTSTPSARASAPARATSRAGKGSTGSTAARPSKPFGAWPTKLQNEVARLWERPAVQQLRADLEVLDVQIPLPRDNRRYMSLDRPEVMAVLATAYRTGVGQRHQALLVLGAPPGNASDEIGKLLDKFDPAIRGKRSTESTSRSLHPRCEESTKKSGL